MQLKLCQRGRDELQNSKNLKRELNPFHLFTRLSRPEEEDKDKSEGEIAKCSSGPGGLSVRQKIQVQFFCKKGFIFMGLFTSSCDRFIFNPSKFTILGNYFAF